MAEGAIAFADARSGSPGESFSRVRMHELGFETPELQARFDGVAAHTRRSTSSGG